MSADRADLAVERAVGRLMGMVGPSEPLCGGGAGGCDDSGTHISRLMSRI